MGADRGKIRELKAALPSIESLTALKKATATEQCGPCPVCKEGTDRFRYWPKKGNWWCRVCDKKGDVIDLHCLIDGLDLKGLMAKHLGPNGDTHRARPKAKGKPFDHYQFGFPTEKYAYLDETGKVISYNCRFQISATDKEFRQCDATGLVWSTKGLKPVLYRMPKLAAADPVYICEGEKDVHSLEALGWTATTNPNGGSSWNGDYAKYLSGKKEIVIFEDNDKTGKDRTAKIVKSLAGKVHTIKVIRFDGKPEHFDVTDFIDSVGDNDQAAEMLSKMIEGAEPYRSNIEPECYLELLTETDDDSADCYEWLIEKLVPKGEPMIIGGKGSSGKSTLALEFSAQVLDLDDRAAVVYICAEGTYRDTKIRARQMGLTRYGRFHFLKRKSGTTSFKLSEKKDLELVSGALAGAKASGLKVTLVTIDSIRGMQRGSLSDDAVGEVMQSVNSEICQKLGATVCYIHHSKKNIQDITAMDALLGSVTIVNSVRHALFLRKHTNLSRTVEVCKSNLGFEDHYFRSKLTDGNRIELIYAGMLGSDDEPEDQGQLDRAEEILLSMLGSGEPVPAYQIFGRGEDQGISANTMRRAQKLHDISVRKIGKVWKWTLKEPKAEHLGNDEHLEHLDDKQLNIFSKEDAQEDAQG